jgi:hypothetical protein
MELASLAGTLGGISQIAAAALGGGKSARGATPQVAVEALGENAVEAALTTAVPDGSPTSTPGSELNWGRPMSDILLPTHIGALVWLVSGLVLCVAETMAPGAFLIWVGLAASIVGAIAYFVTVGLTSELLLFGALVAGLVLLGRRVYRR